MDVHSAERVPPCHLPQLAARIQCGADHVHLADGRYRCWKPRRGFATLNSSHLRDEEKWLWLVSELSSDIHGQGPTDAYPSAAAARDAGLPGHSARSPTRNSHAYHVKGTSRYVLGFETAWDDTRLTKYKTNLWWKHGEPSPPHPRPWAPGPHLPRSKTGLCWV